jgi:hypothetical protein
MVAKHIVSSVAYQPYTNHVAGIGKLPPPLCWYCWYFLVGIFWLVIFGWYFIVQAIFA